MADRLTARNGGRVGLAALVAILLLGLGLRVGEAWDGRAPVYDATAYAAIARNLDAGNGFTVGAGATQPSTNYSPGLPLLAAGIYEATGGVHERLAREVLAVIGALAVLFAYLLGRRMGGIVSRRRRRGEAAAGDSGEPTSGAAVVAGLIAALVVAIYPATIEYTGMLMTEPLAATLLAGAILGILWAGDPLGSPAREVGAPVSGGGGDSPSLWRWLVPGLTLGALALVRPEYLAVGGVLALLVLLRLSFVAHRDTKDNRRLVGLAAAAVVVLGIVLVVAPWTVRNGVALDRFVPVSTGGGQVLYAGTYLPSDGNPEAVGAAVVERNPDLFAPGDAQSLRLEQILARLAAARYPELESDKALSKLGKEQLGNDITEHTGEYVSFLAAKVGRIWSHGPRHIMRTPIWEALHWLLLGFGLLGLGVLAWRRWEALLIGVVFLAITALSALLVASPRRVLVLIPLLSACAGGRRRMGGRRRSRPRQAPVSGRRGAISPRPTANR